MRILLLVSVLALLVAAQWSDMFVAYWFNVSATKMCTIDYPSICYYVPKVNLNVDLETTLVIATYPLFPYDHPNFRVEHVYNVITEYSMLSYIVYFPRPWLLVNITKPGLLYAGSSFRVRYGSLSIQASSYTACGQTYYYAVYISQPGVYNISSFYPPHYLLDIDKCVAYRITATGSGVRNVTSLWFNLYIATMRPSARAFYDTRRHSFALNGTSHVYYVGFDKDRVFPVGTGFYIVGSAPVPTVAVWFNTHGPVAYGSPVNGSWGFRGPAATLYTIGPTPGDGALVAMEINPMQGPVKLVYLSNDTAGFMQGMLYRLTNSFAVFIRRYNIGEITVTDGHYLYNTRGVACPTYQQSFWNTYPLKLNRLDRTVEIEICNNSTNTIYASLFIATSLYSFYLYSDKVDVGNCTRLRWDPSPFSTKPWIFIATSPRDVCLGRYVLSTDRYNIGWRHFYFSNNTIRPVRPIVPDGNYSQVWDQIMQTFSQHYIIIINQTNQRWPTDPTILYDVTELLTDYLNYLSSLFDYRLRALESALSEWLRTILEMLLNAYRPNNSGAPGTSDGSAPTSGPLAPPDTMGPVAPAIPMFVPAIRLQLSPYAVGILLLAIFVAAYATLREISLTALITGAAVSVLGIIIDAYIYSAIGIFFVAFGMWNKFRRQYV